MNASFVAPGMDTLLPVRTRQHEEQEGEAALPRQAKAARRADDDERGAANEERRGSKMEDRAWKVVTNSRLW